MNPDVVISAEHLGKKYQITHQGQRERYTALRDVIARSVSSARHSAANLFRNRSNGSRNHSEEFWALKDVNFEIKRGEVVGIIGRNGAGKSTLLKILSRITEPTEGRVEIEGRVASLLEVGTGFHPELTGRENIYLNGAILGMSRGEIKSRFDEIVAFAEVEKFLDTPVKRYSSGMYVRLAFAVAAHLEPEILVVDEVLAVGDTQFQKKCLGKMNEVARGGRTVLLVSHNLSALRSLCSEGVLLEEGRLQCASTISKVLAAYSAKNASTERFYPEDSVVRRVSIQQDFDRILLELEYSQLEGKLTFPGFCFVIHDVEGRPILGHNPLMEQQNVSAAWSNPGVIRASVRSPRLLDGIYTVSVFFGDHYSTIFRDPNCLTISIEGFPDALYQLPPEHVGPVYPECRYEFLPLGSKSVVINNCGALAT